MTQATNYTKLTLSDRENTSNGELDHVTFVKEDKETERKEQKSKWTQCKKSAMDTRKRFLNKVQNLNLVRIAAVTVLVAVVGFFLLFAMSKVSSREMHDSLKETIVKVNTTQVIENKAMRSELEDLRTKYQLVVSMVTELKQQQNSTVMNLTRHIDKSIDSLDQKHTETHNNTEAKVSKLSTKSKQMELTLTSANDKIQSLTTGFKELKVQTRENNNLLQELKTQMVNDAARLEAIVKRVDELKSEKSVTDKELRKNIDDLSKKVSRTEQNTKDIYDRIEKLNKQNTHFATSIDSQNREIETIRAKIESQGKRLDYHDRKVTQIEGKQVSLTEQTNAHDQRFNRLLESVRSSGSRVTGSTFIIALFTSCCLLLTKYFDL